MSLLATLALSMSLVNQQQPAFPPLPKRAQILLLGTYHFANPGRDVVKAPLDDHLAPKRQEQILAIVDKLAKFKPTKIAVEEPFGNPDTAKRYAAWLAGEMPLRVNETDQIGFRLAKATGAQIVPIDHKLDMDFDTFMKKAPATTMDKFQSAIGEAQKMMEGLSQHTVSENLRMFNTREADQATNGLYLSLLDARSGDTYPGVDLVGSWWRRNLYWTANLMTLATSPDERILVICGAGHASLLRSLLRDSRELEVVDTNTHLP